MSKQKITPTNLRDFKSLISIDSQRDKCSESYKNETRNHLSIKKRKFLTTITLIMEHYHYWISQNIYYKINLCWRRRLFILWLRLFSNQNVKEKSHSNLIQKVERKGKESINELLLARFKIKTTTTTEKTWFFHNYHGHLFPNKIALEHKNPIIFLLHQLKQAFSEKGRYLHSWNSQILRLKYLFLKQNKWAQH